MWIHRPLELLSVDIVPHKKDTTSDWINKLSRILFIILLILIYYAYSKMTILIFLLSGIGIILIIYLLFNKKENFSCHYKMEYNDQHSQSSQDSSAPLQSPQELKIQQLQQQLQELQQQLQHPQQQPQPQLSYQEIPEQIRSYHQQARRIDHQHLYSQGQANIESRYTPISHTTSIHTTSIHTTPISHTTPIHTTPIHTTPIHTTPIHTTPIEQENPEKEKTPEYYTPYVGTNKKIQHKLFMVPRIMDSEFSNIETNSLADNNPVQTMDGMGMTDIRINRDRRRVKPNYETISSSELPRLFIQDVQPNLYSITNERTPINSNIGISSTPQIPERKRYHIKEGDRSYPLYSRIDPQLIRDDVSKERKEELPKRNEWSQKMYLEADGNDPYDPRDTGYSDSNRSYYDTKLGQIKYYYTDTDAYRKPNFVIRNKIDHVDFIDPMSNVDSRYIRSEALDDVHDMVHDDWIEKSTEFREDIMERLMRKNNSMNWQLRFAPKSKGARLSTFTSSY